MAVEAKITLFGDTLFRRRIQAMRYRARNMSPILNDIADEWLNITEEQFATEGARSGTPWKPLARETKFRRGSAHPILVHTGDLLIHMTDPSLLNVTDDEITMELPASIRTVAASHQFGYDNVSAGHHVAARPMVAFTPLDEQRWRQKITDFLVNGRL